MSLVVRWDRWRHPGYGTCLGCGHTWAERDPHIVQYSLTHGVFCLCEPCWGGMSRDERIMYFRVAWRLYGWGDQHPLHEILWEIIFGRG